MITPAYLQCMARYNRWQNGALMAAADTLDDAARRLERGAFWGSIHGTLSHLLWGDLVWMSRFDGGDKPAIPIAESGGWVAQWDELKVGRLLTDERILGWADAAGAADIEGEMSWFSGAIGRDITRPKALCLMQLFNHQTHHRGQVHAMLTSAGASPEDTDLPFMPDTV
jgi:uncharacterized damage-inducible protein DinB